MRAKHVVLLTVVLCLLLSATAMGGRDDLIGHPGYVDFRRLSIASGEEPKVEVNISGSLLRLVGMAAKEEDPELSTAIAGLQAIRVEVYPLHQSTADKALDQLSAIADELSNSGWETMVRVRDKDEQAYVATKTEGDNIVGLIVMSADRDDDEIALVNIVGTINLEELWRIGDEFDIDHLDSVRDARHEAKSSKR
ncbi:MAG: hypothetical protein Kow0074_04870 [Candidatus Zixiibacteriota bacterium]